MRALGYVLIGFNLIAAGAFAYFATQDYKGRTEINGSVKKHIVILTGVPFEGPEEMTTTDPEGEVDFKLNYISGSFITAVPPQFLQNYFNDAPVGDSKSIFASNTPMPSQLGELKRVRAKIKEAFEAAGNPQQKTRLLQAWLELGVESYVERAVIQKAAEKGDWGTLAVFLDMRFQQVNPKLLEGSSAPLSSDHWEKLPGRIEAVERDLKKAESDRDAAEKDLTQSETAAQKVMADLAAASKKLVEAERLYERLLREGNVKLAEEAAKEVAAATPDVARYSAQAKPLLQTSAERTRLAETAQRKVDELFTELSMLRRSAVPDTDGRMTRLAHLLVHLDADAAWQKRAMLVVGLRKYVKVVAAQAERYAGMARALDSQIRREQEHYSVAMAAFREQAMQRTRLVMEITASREKLEQQRDKDKTFVEQRKSQLADLEAQLTKIKADVAALLAQQTSLEQELFILQREIAVTLEEVYALQDELREAERARFSIPK